MHSNTPGKGIIGSVQKFFTNKAQELAFCESIWSGHGGSWDYKKQIGEQWGEKDRLGNSAIVYYYDIWANINYGFIGRKLSFTDDILMKGADHGQGVDNPGQNKDDPEDTSSIREGMQLAQKDNITVDDLIQIVERHPEWDFDTRFRKK